MNTRLLAPNALVRVSNLYPCTIIYQAQNGVREVVPTVFITDNVETAQRMGEIFATQLLKRNNGKQGSSFVLIGESVFREDGSNFYRKII